MNIYIYFNNHYECAFKQDVDGHYYVCTSNNSSTPDDDEFAKVTESWKANKYAVSLNIERSKPQVSIVLQSKHIDQRYHVNIHINIYSQNTLGEYYGYSTNKMRVLELPKKITYFPTSCVIRLL